jgi:predicted ATPase
LEEAEPHLRTCIELSKKYSLAGYLFPAELKEGLTRAVRGDTEAGLQQADAALKSLRAIPSRRFHLPIRIAIVGRAKAATGDVEGALALFDSALEAAATYGERWYEPELLRLRAEMLLAKSGQNSEAAEQCLQAAIAMAQTQQALFWELRSATVLARLWHRLGRQDQAREILTPVYGRFTEGLNTSDLQDAKMLVERLAP